jgi:hypothetical protein
VEHEIVEGHTSKYPWTAWADGRVWLVRWMQEFPCVPSSIQSQAHMWAGRMGLSVATRQVDGGVLMQFFPQGSTWKPNLSAVNENRIRKAVENTR